MNRNRLVLFLFLALTLTGGFVAGQAVRPNLGWYAALAKPWFNPPAAAFAPVWSLLYILMAVAAWRVWRIAGGGMPLRLWFGQWVLNLAWTPLFFAAHRPDLALIDLTVLWLTIACTIFAFHRVDRRAAWLMTPYFVWVIFAGALNAAIWRLN